MVHAALKGAIEMREGLCARAESHVLAEVVARPMGGFGSIGILDAVAALLAGDSDFESDALAYAEAR